MSEELKKLYRALLGHSALFRVEEVNNSDEETYIFLKHIGTYWPQIEPVCFVGQEGIEIRLRPNE